MHQPLSQHSTHQQEPEQQKQSQEVFFHLIQKVGAMGRYQITLFLTLSTISLMTGSTILATPFLFFQDHYECPGDLSSKQCKDLVCSLAPQNRTPFIPRQQTIKSFANKFGDYRCPNEQVELDLIKSIYYSGQLFGFFTTSLIGDLFRSKVLVVAGLVTAVFGLILLTATNIFWVSIIGSFLLPFGITIAYNLTYIFITEIVEQKRRQTYKIIIASIFSCGGLSNVLWFFLIPDFELVLIFFFGIPTVALTIIFILFFKDTPISMITKSSPEKAYKNLMYIARVNGRNPNLSIQEIKQTQDKYKKQYLSKTTLNPKKFTILDLFRYKSLRVMTITLIFLDCVFALQYLTPTLMLNQFNFDIFLNGAAIQSAQLVAGLVGYLTIYKLPRKKQGCTSFGIIMACSIVLIFIWDQNQTEVTDIGSNLVVLIFLFFIELVVSNAFNFYAIYLNQLYPTQVRIIGVGFIKTFGSITMMVSSQIINACVNNEFKIMILFAILAAVSGLLCLSLPQTHGKRPPEVIEELAHPSSDKQYSK